MVTNNRDGTWFDKSTLFQNHVLMHLYAHTHTYSHVDMIRGYEN